MVTFLKQSLVLYIHQPGDEIWISVGLTMNGMVTLNIEASQNVHSVEFALAEKRTTYLSTQLNPCRLSETSRNEFNLCTQKAFCSLAKIHVNCTIPGINSLLGTDCQLPYCEDLTSASKTFMFFLQEIQMKHLAGIRMNCVRPCLEISYNYEMRYFHENSFIDVFDNAESHGHFLDTHLLMDLFLSTDLVEERTETLIHDKTSFWSAVGGNLGLVLGFSCFSIVFQLFSLVERIYRKYF